MLILLALTAAAAGILISLKKNFISVWLHSFNVIISVHLSILILGMLGSAEAASLNTAAVKGGALLVIAGVIYVFLTFAAKLLLSNIPDLNLPAILDLTLKPAAAGFACWLGFWFIIFAAGTTASGSLPAIQDKLQKTNKTAAKQITACESIARELSLCEDEDVLPEVIRWIRESEN
ncbi:hypothetical protein L21SP3_02077 [Sedimentisphaera cyanobacteriorum]|uniref:Uncharacterized protein n=1 Tax=Sedimentisphaera cyanobacteriorum TaxID=1940790 RepID=A0A1Q2HS15_9BACT|nr:hypothetical protein [Sedimentisphaera cyanobacteriorum]AQQ10249.1 hypothetical protein L21SP3_02077 [Sedimentisphaera cyanobacteriorum]